MSGYTPTLEEAREAVAEWMWSRRMWRAECSTADGHELDRMIAEVERAAAARALEEAADEILVQHSEFDPGKRMAFHRGADAVYDALRARAAEIREGKKDER